jgi:hypothetical protein
MSLNCIKIIIDCMPNNVKKQSKWRFQQVFPRGPFYIGREGTD